MMIILVIHFKIFDFLQPFFIITNKYFVDKKISYLGLTRYRESCIEFSNLSYKKKYFTINDDLKP